MSACARCAARAGRRPRRTRRRTYQRVTTPYRLRHLHGMVTKSQMHDRLIFSDEESLAGNDVAGRWKERQECCFCCSAAGADTAPGRLLSASGEKASTTYPGERKFLCLPVARLIGLLFFSYSCASGVYFIAYDLCTAGMRLVAVVALGVSTIFTAVAFLHPRPLPLTFSFAIANGLHPCCAAFYVLYHGALVGVVACLVAFCLVVNFISFRGFLSWSCFDDDGGGDDDDHRWALRGRRRALEE